MLTPLLSRAPDQILRGILLMLVFCLLAPLLDVASKLATADIPVGQITAARFIVQGALMVPVMVMMRIEWTLSKRMVKYV
ncbi:MAG: EamA/RhaT family transporter, partial [Rhodobacteraceae bacterium]|nr:EamA/RhaT family transporter [Paracoccaceae bacterium]